MKTVWKSIPILFFLSVIIPMSATAEFYRYVDPHGNVIYTDDISKVPVDKRSQAKMYDESPASTPETTTSEQTVKTKSAPKAEKLEAIKQEGQRLQTIQKELSQEYDDLVKENAALKAEQQKAITPEQIKTVNKKVVSFNARFNAYKEKESAYTAQLEAYNQRVLDAEAEPGEKE